MAATTIDRIEMNYNKTSDPFEDNVNSNNFTVIYDHSFSDVVWFALSSTTLFIVILFVVTCIRVLVIGQKTRSPPQRRGVYLGSRARPSLGTEPSIYVSPSNLPPPPKYEFMAPPSYEEVVGIHYPQMQGEPITQPITSALAQSSSQSTSDTVTTVNETSSNARVNDSQATVTERPVATASS